MSKSGRIALTVLITFAFAMVGISNVVAGVTYKGRAVKYCTKFEQIETGHVEGHIILIYEDRAIHTNLEGKSFMDGWLERECGYGEMNPKTGSGWVRCFGVITDKDGDQIHWTGEGPLKGAVWEVPWSFVKGSGKFVGIKGKGHFTAHNPTPTQWYADWKMEVELP
jgi:hypothetical protein